jgi:hypothetical protein
MDAAVKSRDPSNTPPPEEPSAPGTAPPRRSGRVQFDSRGQAVWEWAVRTGMFDRNASTQRIKALVETPLSLTEDPKPDAKAADSRDAGLAASRRVGSAAVPSGSTPARPTPAVRPASGNPYERAEPLPKLKPGESTGFDPYGRGPSKPRGTR